MILKCSKLALAMTVGFVGAPLIARSQPALQPDEIRIVVSGVRNQKGSVICSLWACANSDEFTKTGTQTRKLSVPIHDSQAVCEFEALPAGGVGGTCFDGGFWLTNVLLLFVVFGKLAWNLAEADCLVLWGSWESEINTEISE